MPLNLLLDAADEDALIVAFIVVVSVVADVRISSNDYLSRPSHSVWGLNRVREADDNLDEIYFSGSD